MLPGAAKPYALTRENAGSLLPAGAGSHGKLLTRQARLPDQLLPEVHRQRLRVQASWRYTPIGIKGYGLRSIVWGLRMRSGRRNGAVHACHFICI